MRFKIALVAASIATLAVAALADERRRPATDPQPQHKTRTAAQDCTGVDYKLVDGRVVPICNLRFDTTGGFDFWEFQEKFQSGGR